MFDLTLMQKYMLDTPLVNEFIESCVARCDYCGMPIFKCKCEKEDEEEYESGIEETEEEHEESYTDEELGITQACEDANAFGPNFSDADHGL